MITVKKLKEMLSFLPDNAEISAYQGEDVGINVKLLLNHNLFINAKYSNKEDKQDEFFDGLKLVKPLIREMNNDNKKKCRN